MGYNFLTYTVCTYMNLTKKPIMCSLCPNMHYL